MRRIVVAWYAPSRVHSIGSVLKSADASREPHSSIFSSKPQSAYRASAAIRAALISSCEIAPCMRSGSRSARSGLRPLTACRNSRMQLRDRQ